MAGFFEQNDPVGFAPQLSVVFPRTGLNLESLTRPVALVTKALRSKLSADNKLVVDSYKLDKTKAATYAGIFERKAERASIPWILGPASLIPGIGTAITIATSTIDGLMRLGNSSSVSATQLVVLMADGGSFVKTWSVERHPQHGELLVTMVFYSVVVGKESRMHGIYSDKFAMRVQG
jgi:hypothetical protein